MVLIVQLGGFLLVTPRVLTVTLQTPGPRHGCEVNQNLRWKKTYKTQSGSSSIYKQQVQQYCYSTRYQIFMRLAYLAQFKKFLSCSVYLSNYFRWVKSKKIIAGCVVKQHAFKMYCAVVVRSHIVRNFYQVIIKISC
jgi:hypothetical protein